MDVPEQAQSHPTKMQTSDDDESPEACSVSEHIRTSGDQSSVGRQLSLINRTLSRDNGQTNDNNGETTTDNDDQTTTKTKQITCDEVSTCI